MLGDEPAFSSSHMGFLGTCDYIWYTPTASSGRPLGEALWPGLSEEYQVYEAGVLSSSGNDDSGLEGADGAAAAAGSGGGGSSGAAVSGHVLQPVAVLQCPDIQLLPQGLPAARFGSDHLPLCTRFMLTPLQGGHDPAPAPADPLL